MSKNLWSITTDELSHGKYSMFNKQGEPYIWDTDTMGSLKTKPTRNIYITSDEEIISFNEINSLPLSDGKDIQTNMPNI